MDENKDSCRAAAQRSQPTPRRFAPLPCLAPELRTRAIARIPHPAFELLPETPLTLPVLVAPFTNRKPPLALLPNLVQLPRRLQQLQLRLLPLAIRIPKSHPFIILIEPRSFQ